MQISHTPAFAATPTGRPQTAIRPAIQPMETAPAEAGPVQFGKLSVRKGLAAAFLAGAALLTSACAGAPGQPEQPPTPAEQSSLFKRYQECKGTADDLARAMAESGDMEPTVYHCDVARSSEYNNGTLDIAVNPSKFAK